MILPKQTYGAFHPWDEKKDKEFEAEKPVFVARDYQIEMLNVAKKENAIVMMPTGSGKTYVAVLLIKHFLNQVMSDPIEDPNWKRTFFLVNQVTLVTQQAKVLERHTGVEVGTYSGSHSSKIDTWSEATWFHEFKKKQILVMTAQIFLDLLSTGFLKTQNVNVLVLDECHHAKENHTMAKIMVDFWNPEDPTGRVLGLTASVIDKKKIKKSYDLEATIQKLCTMLNARLVTPLEFSNQLQHTDLPTPAIQIYNNGNYGVALLGVMEDLLFEFNSMSSKSLPEEEQSSFQHIKKLNNMLPKILYEIGVDCLRETLPDIKAEISKYLYGPLIAPLCDAQGIMQECTTYQMGNSLLNKLPIIRKFADEIVKHSSELRMSVKFYSLLKYLVKLQCSSKQPPRIIIFVETRSVVTAMHKYLDKLRREVECCGNLKAAYVLGGTTGKGSTEETNKLTDIEDLELKKVKKRQEQAILDFREGRCNILIATSVVEEGLDIPACNVVIRYDFPPTYRAYVQSRGRARQKPATFTFFISQSDKKDKEETLEGFDHVEMLLKKYAQSRVSRDPDAEDDDTNYNTLIPPLQVLQSGAKVTAQSAIQRLNFYCAQLPKDEYTDVRPIEVSILIEDGDQKIYQTTLTLPKLCPIKAEIHGESMPSKKLAKMSAAMKALRALYDAKELTDALLPQYRQKEKNHLLIMSEGGQTDNTVDQKLKIPSTMWRKNLQEDSKFFMSSINIILTSTVDNYNNTKLHKVVCFGILTKTKMPDFPHFKVYPPYGVATVFIKFEREISIPANVLSDYYWFQEALFTHILEINNVKVLSDALFKNYLVLPLCKKMKGSQIHSTMPNSETYLDVDNRFIQQLKKQWNEKLGHWRFGNMPQEPEKCLDCVIFPAYKFPKEEANRNISGFLYSVMSISDLSPQNKLRGREDEETYEGYHVRRHKVVLKNPTQKLLLCHHVTRHYDFLSFKKGSKTKYTDKDSRVLYLIGEIHKVHPMPASLWDQAICLPSILWRLETFLLSQELTASLYRDSQRETGLLSSNIENYFLDDVRDMKKMLRRDLEYRGQVDWVETLQAITHKSCHEDFNLERIEFLGDKFLKFASTLFYYRAMPDKHEGWLTKYRSELVSNDNLAIRSSKAISLPRYILNKLVSPKENWIPPCCVPSLLWDKINKKQEFTADSYSLGADITDYLKSSLRDSDNLNSSEEVEHVLQELCSKHIHRLGTKDIADSMEALIGLTLSRYGYRSSVELLDLIEITTFQCEEGEAPVKLQDYLYKATPLSQIYSLPDNGRWLAKTRCDSLVPVQKRLGYTFKDPLYLLEALTHASYGQIDTCYQRLEFLGDAVLDMLMVAHIYEHNPQHDQGKMTLVLSSLVCNTTLSKICTTLELHTDLLYDNVGLYNVLARFYMNFDKEQLSRWCGDLSLESVFIDAVEQDTMDEILVMDLESKVVQTPKLLGDLVESVIGAIYLDSGEDMEQVWGVIWPWFEHFYDSYSASPPKNPKALVNEAYPGAKREIIIHPGDVHRCVATITIEKRGPDGKLDKYEFKTIGRDRETAMEVCYGRAWHFHKKYLLTEDTEVH